MYPPHVPPQLLHSGYPRLSLSWMGMTVLTLLARMLKYASQAKSHGIKIAGEPTGTDEDQPTGHVTLVFLTSFVPNYTLVFGSVHKPKNGKEN